MYVSCCNHCIHELGPTWKQSKDRNATAKSSNEKPKYLAWYFELSNELCWFNFLQSKFSGNQAIPAKIIIIFHRWVKFFFFKNIEKLMHTMYLFLNSSKLHNAGLYIHSRVFIHFSLHLSNARLLAHEYCSLYITQWCGYWFFALTPSWQRPLSYRN